MKIQKIFTPVLEWDADSEDVQRVIDFLQTTMKVSKIRFPETSSIGIKPISREGSERLIRAAIEYALSHGLKHVTLVHKGNIQKFTEGGFRKWVMSLLSVSMLISLLMVR